LLITQKFLAGWRSQVKDSFDQDAPNAFLHGLQEAPQANQQAQSHQKKVQDLKIIKVAVQLAQPTFDPQNHSVTYMINPLDGEENKLSATTIYQVTLFIDDGCLTCW